MKRTLVTVLPFLALAALATVLAVFIVLFRPNLGGALGAVPEIFHGDWRFPVDAAMAVVTVAVMWFAAAGLGLLALWRAGAERFFPSPWQRLVFAPLIGWVALGTSILLLGLAGQCSRLALGVFLIAAAVAGIAGWRWFFTALIAEDVSDFRLPPWLIALALGLYALAVAYAATPSIESDELRYHLAAPEAYLEAGRIHYLPHQANSNFPFLIEMLFTMAMALQGAEAAKVLHLTFLETSATLTGLLCYLLIRSTFFAGGRPSRQRSRLFAMVAAVGLATVPSALILACWAFVDIATVAYFMAVVYLGALALAGGRTPAAWLIGLMAAGAVGTKYSMAPAMALAAGWLALLLATRPRRPGAEPLRLGRYAGQAMAVAALVAAPWFVKNLAWTGNPVYPLAYGIFGGEDWSEGAAQFYAEKAGEKGLHLGEPGGADTPEFISGLPRPARRLIELAISPISTSLAFERFENHFVGPGPLMAMALVAVGAAAFGLGRNKKRRSRGAHGPILWVAGLLLLNWLLWFFSYQSNRMLLPALALVFALAGWGAAVLFAQARGAPWRRPVAVAMGALLALATLYSSSIVFIRVVGSGAASGAVSPVRVSLGFERPDEFLSKTLAHYPSARWLGARLEPDRKALLIGEHRTLYFPNDVVANDWFDTPQPLDFIEETATNDELLDRLLAEGVAYIYFNWDEMKKYAGIYLDPRTARNPRFTSEQYARFENLMASARLKEVYRDERYEITVYEIARN